MLGSAQSTEGNLEMEIDQILEERGTRYGEFEDQAIVNQNIKEAMRRSPNWAMLEPDMKEALEMMATKIGRILNGDPSYADSWRDAEGYLKLVADRLERGVSIDAN